MRRNIIIALILGIMAILPTSCIGQAKVFKEVAALPNVTSVYIGKAAMRLGMAAAMMDGEIAAMKAIKDINSLEVINCDHAATIPEATRLADKAIQRLNLELLVDTQEDREHTAIYGGVADDDHPDIIHNLLIYNTEPGELNLVFIKGKINVAELMKEYCD